MYVEVIPLCEDLELELDCFIYGEISVKVGQSSVPIPLFSRKRQDPALVVLGDPHRKFLFLPDGVASPPPLEAVSKHNPILVTMKLHEKRSSGEDRLIAEVTDLDYAHELVGRCSYFDVPGTDESKFSFRVCYAVILGARVEIEVKIKTPTEDEEGSIPRERKSPVPISAKIVAIQNLNDCLSCSCGQAIRPMYHRSEQVYVGDKLRLERNVLSLPMAYDQYLSIALHPTTVPPKKPLPIGEEHEHHLVDFYIKRVTKESFMTNKELTHTKVLVFVHKANLDLV